MRNLVTIDCHYLRPQLAAAYLIIDEDRAIFVENNTALATPLLLESLKNKGPTPQQVDYIIVTHIHLDHAGGSHSLMEACPNATLLVHPKGSRTSNRPNQIGK